MRLYAAVIHVDAGAAHQVAVLTLVHQLRQARPEHRDGSAVAVVSVDAGAADLHDVAAQVGQTHQLELALAVEATGSAGATAVEDAGSGDNLAAALITHDQVFAVQVVMVLIQSLVGAVQLCTALLSEYLKAQGLCRLKRGGVAR